MIDETVFDFHTHSVLSDGELIPMELIRRAMVAGYQAIAIADHAGPGDLETVIPRLCQDCAMASKYWGIIAITGVEITHAPPGCIPELAARAKELGAELVVVHGETIGEPVEPGTNLAALSSTHVDILAHPGLLSAGEAEIARAKGIYLELSASRSAHAHTNGHVARTALAAGASLLVNSDAHAPTGLLTARRQRQVAMGAGLDENLLPAVLSSNPRHLLAKIGRTV